MGPVSLRWTAGETAVLHDVYFDVYDRYAVAKNGIPHARLTAALSPALRAGLAGRYAIERVKQIAPIWKREVGRYSFQHAVIKTGYVPGLILKQKQNCNGGKTGNAG